MVGAKARLNYVKIFIFQTIKNWQELSKKKRIYFNYKNIGTEKKKVRSFRLDRNYGFYRVSL